LTQRQSGLWLQRRDTSISPLSVENSLASLARLNFATNRVRRALAIAALAIVYVVAARAGLMLDAVAGFATVVWPPSGLALAALLIFGMDLWPGVFIGAFLANLVTGAPVAVAMGIAMGNTLEPVLAVYALRRIAGSGSLSSVWSTWRG